MLSYRIRAATATVALFTLASVGFAADSQPMHMMDHHDVTILHMVETASTPADHEAVAKRFEEEAARYEKQAAEHEALAAQYRKAPGNPKWNNNSSALADHCDRLVKSLKASATEARDMAQLHRDVGKLTTPDGGK